MYFATYAMLADANAFYNKTGTKEAFEIYEAARGSYHKGQDLVDAGQRSAEVSQAKARHDARGY